MDSAMDWHRARALLEWQVELGATDAVGDTPVNRYEVAATPKAEVAKPNVAAGPVGVPATPRVDAVAEARSAAGAADSLDALRAAMDAFPHCELKLGARQLVFSDGVPGARVMIVGESPGRDEDLQGKPFVGRAGQLLDRMVGAIGLDRGAAQVADAVYITNVIPWRPPRNRDPEAEEIAMMLPFLERHIALAQPQVLVAVGNISCQALLGRRGITRLRGGWAEAFGKPVMPMFHPAYLLRNPAAKRETWADLLEVNARLKGRT
ncbi:uracil-DNA glycosylase [Primorskyibacter flagellatus]|uniref:uracil-DNA glycosylase n=1 Tax=Primorskyibacter flagellatus TaxID=1387277 RepID=UPI003A959320